MGQGSGMGGGIGGMFWRFLVASDPAVDRYIIRDSDSRLNPRERRPPPCPRLPLPATPRCLPHTPFPTNHPAIPPPAGWRWRSGSAAARGSTRCATTPTTTDRSTAACGAASTGRCRTWRRWCGAGPTGTSTWVRETALLPSSPLSRHPRRERRRLTAPASRWYRRSRLSQRESLAGRAGVAALARRVHVRKVRGLAPLPDAPARRFPARWAGLPWGRKAAQGRHRQLHAAGGGAARVPRREVVDKRVTRRAGSYVCGRVSFEPRLGRAEIALPGILREEGVRRQERAARDTIFLILWLVRLVSPTSSRVITSGRCASPPRV